MKKHILFAVALVILLVGCSLKRSNPLDPNANNLIVPQDITHLTATPSAAHTTNHYVTLRWDKLPTENADGYYIYRGQSYDGAYQKIFDKPNLQNPTDLIVSWDDSALDPVTNPNGIVPGDYYYKVSAHKYQNSNPNQILEGHISSYVYTRVPQ